MGHWIPPRDWEGQTAFIIGGGPSLARFDFTKLIGRNTIGCNDAFQLGPEIVRYCLFGDASFFHKHRDKLMASKVEQITCAPALLHFQLIKIHKMNRVRDGIHDKDTLGWNYSTGAAAVNLAFSMGAKRIFLLGFDMGKQPDGKSHWHNNPRKVIKEESYTRFIRGFHTLAQSISRFPDVKVFNVTDGSSRLPVFDRLSFTEFDGQLSTKTRNTGHEVQAGQPSVASKPGGKA